MTQALVTKYPSLWLSKSWTTRQRRHAESEDAYVFVTKDQFQAKIAEDGFLEYAEFLDNFYGTPIPSADSDAVVVLEIEVQGARQVQQKDDAALLIFLEAPSRYEQEARLTRRGDTPAKIKQRLEKSAEEVDAGRELGAQIFINHDVDETVEAIFALIEKAQHQKGAGQ